MHDMTHIHILANAVSFVHVFSSFHYDVVHELSLSLSDT